ncbi:hypothetical protein D187_008874 [Cystobacter fuscus DSM 2262]|uniref:Uncharacterized protein n=1 Tax=Cystobacter fuscus (strain ATCC 25194 / DSM 2262 / NBRC 100088 / M29) TaxID=1242864 RepID=S9PI05_CYSF2|nr:hypothetical protein D187_008874 [Cystobacter fuscus DSM 2262]
MVTLPPESPRWDTASEGKSPKDRWDAGRKPCVSPPSSHPIGRRASGGTQ